MNDYICFIARNREELNHIVEEGFKRGFDMNDHDKNQLGFYINFPVYIFFSLFNNLIMTPIKLPFAFLNRESIHTIEDFIEWRISDGININRKVFTYEDIKNFDHIVKFGTTKPSYKPKKVIKESVSKYPYRFKTMDEFHEEYGDEWYASRGPLGKWGWDEECDIHLGQVLELDKTYFLPKVNDKFHIYLDNNFQEQKTYLATHEKVKDEYGYEMDIYWNMLTNNEDYWKKPTYKPRDILRESNTVYNEFIIKLESDNDLSYVIERLKPSGLFYRDFGFRNIYYPNWMYVNIKNENFSLWDYVEIPQYIVENYINNSPEAYPHIIKVEDTNKVANYVNFGKFDFKPTYKPKSILKESNKKFNEICVKIDSKNTYYKIMELLNEHNYDTEHAYIGNYLNIKGDIEYDDNGYIIFYINDKKRNVTYSPSTFWEYIIIDEKHIYPKILSIDEDYNKILTFLKFGVVIDKPTYSRKKIDKLNESKNNYKCLVIKCLNQGEFYETLNHLFNENITWPNGDKTFNTITRYPIYIFVNFEKGYFFKSDESGLDGDWTNDIYERIIYTALNRYANRNINNRNEIFPQIITPRKLTSISLYYFEDGRALGPIYKPKIIEK